METKNNPAARLAAELVRPYLLPGQGGNPLSFRALPEGGMVVIAPDGRKLWFTCREVNTARQALNLPAVRPSAANDGLTDQSILPAANANSPVLNQPERSPHDQPGLHQRKRTPAAQ